MKKWAFVSDFDGTITKEDFYWTVIHEYYPEGKSLHKKWKAGKLKDIDFLAKIFSSIDKEENQIIQTVHSMPIDEHVPAFIQKVQDHGGDFIILSAGTNYYIKRLLEKYKIKNVQIYANEGYFHNNNIRLRLDENIWYHSERYGIDKSKVIRKLKTKYESVYFIGDSEPDSHPAVDADITFAKGVLQSLLRERKIPFQPVESFIEVEQYMRQERIFK